jgi:hypothetical protein
MAIAYISGANNSATTSVTTITATYSPTAGNMVVVGVAFPATPGSSPVVKDNLGNTLTPGPSQGTAPYIYTFAQSPAPSGVTGYTATWTGGQNAGIAVAEYSGPANSGVDVTHGIATTAVNSTSASLSVPLDGANDFVVMVACSISGNLTTSVGNQRQQATTGGIRITLQDNTGTTAGASVTNTCTQASASWICAAAVTVGGPGFSRANQDLQLVIKRPTSAKVRVNQDVELVVKRPTSSKAGVNQSLSLVVFRHGRVGVRLNQDIVLVVRKNPHGVIFQPNVCVCT